MKSFFLLFCVFLFPSFVNGANVYFDYPSPNSSFQMNCDGTKGINYHIRTVSAFFNVDWYGARVQYPDGHWGAWDNGQSGGWVFSQLGTYQIEGAVHVVADLDNPPHYDYYMYSEIKPFYLVDTSPTVSISGPTIIEWGQNYTWTASASNGNPSYSYQWYNLFGIIEGPMNIIPNLPPRNVWLPIGTNSFSLTHSFPLYPNINLKCVITDNCQLHATSNILELNSSGDSRILKSQQDIQNCNSINLQDNTDVLSSDYYLWQNSPNPFNPSTVIEYQLPENGFVILRIIDILGREVETLVNENKSKGRYSVTFNALNLNSGIYFYQLNTSNFTSIKKMILLK